MFRKRSGRLFPPAWAGIDRAHGREDGCRDFLRQPIGLPRYFSQAEYQTYLFYNLLFFQSAIKYPYYVVYTPSLKIKFSPNGFKCVNSSIGPFINVAEMLGTVLVAIAWFAI